ncbi:MFS transporter [Microbacterium sp. AG238]|uniref:MFS transporter n=1 Tax=Microbacterium sp. AG238 TaxID=2183994 RepID=UPI000E74B086|nr:MFS transporter [Microbacterium sp. AG238]RKE63133.1 MFS transporter [Microbacterium sp. AG238]
MSVITASSTLTPPSARPLGRDFSRLWTAAAFSNLADGLGRTAVPLIATTLTRDPLLISLLGAAAFVPWLVFGVPAGMIVDRFDRRRVMALANTVRGLAAVGLAVLTVAGGLDVTWLLVGTLVFGFGETLFDNATNAVIPSVVARDQLDRANGRIQAAQITIDSFLAQPVAGVLFAVSLGLPLWLGAAGYIVPIALALLLPVAAARSRSSSVVGGDRGEVVAGAVPEPLPAAPAAPVPARDALRYLWRHRFLRALVVFTSVVGCAFAFAQAPTLLYFLDVHGLPEIAIGFVTAGVGVGALAGSLLAARLVSRFGRGNVMWGANLAAAVCMVGVGFAPNLVVAIVAYAGMAFAVSLWNVPWGALRQQIIPPDLFGRTLGIIRTLTWGLFPVATVLGGLVASLDLRLPFITAGIVCLVATTICTRLIRSASAQVSPAVSE